MSSGQSLIGPSDMILFSVLTNQTYPVPWLEQRRKTNKVTEKIILYSMNVKIEKNHKFNTFKFKYFKFKKM